MKLIDISTPKYPNTFTMVDDEDFDFLNQWKWTATKRVYVIRMDYSNRKRIKLFIHREILKPQVGEIIDHINGNRLDNRRVNIRVCSYSENMWNKIKPRNGKTSKYKGVSFDAHAKLFRAKINVKRIPISLGYFKTELDAAMAYNAAAFKYHGEFAAINSLPGSHPT